MCEIAIIDPLDFQFVANFEGSSLPYSQALTFARQYSLQYSQLVDLSPNNSQVAQYCNLTRSSSDIFICDTETGQITVEFRDLESPTFAVAWSPTGEILASGYDNGTFRLWDVANHRSKARIQGPSEAVTSITWNSSGTRFATASLDGTVRVWEILVLNP
ncbi:hypothetical protein HC928_14585 [bacterium]|nr:hypothetical protein [bacterium]